MNKKFIAKDKKLSSFKTKPVKNFKGSALNVSGKKKALDFDAKKVTTQAQESHPQTVKQKHNCDRRMQKQQTENKSQKSQIPEGKIQTVAHKKKGRKKKSKPDGASNWMNLCSTLNICVKRKEKPVKRKADSQSVSELSQPESKRSKDTKDEIWFDNVDEIFIEASTNHDNVNKDDKVSNTEVEKTKSDTDAKLIKPDSFPGLTQCVAMDCEMVGIGADGSESMLARVSIVNHFGVCLYDKFVLPREPVTDYRTFVSGITKENLGTGEEFDKVQKEVSDILKGRTLVGHAVHNDLRVLFLTHPRIDIRDTSQYEPFRELFNGRIPALKKLSNKLLGVAVQTGQHSSVQDAQATMRLYTMYRQRWEKELRVKVKQQGNSNTK